MRKERKRAIRWAYLIMGVLWIAVGLFRIWWDHGWNFGIACVAIGAAYEILGLVGKPKKKEYAKQSVEERLRELMKDYSREQLKAIVEDDYRNEEIKSVAFDLLAKK